MERDIDAPAWFLDELAHAGPEHLEPEQVARYDRKASWDPAPDIARLLELGIDERQTLVDLGAGTGTLALAAAPHYGRVVAVDPSPRMLARLREKAATSGAGNIEIVRAGFLSYEHRGPTADVVYSRNALHHLPDFWKALALHRVAEMMAPGGILLLRDLIIACELEEIEAVIERWLHGAATAAERGWTRDELERHLRQEHSTFSWLLEPMLERAGFEILEARHADSALYAAYLCRRWP